MNQKWKYVLPVTATSLSLFTSFVNADTTTSAQMRNIENRINALEQRKGAGGMINPQGRPQVKDGADLFFFGNLLYWNAHEEALSIALKQENNIDTSVQLNEASAINVRGKWNWGFRAGVGYNTPHDGWDLKATWLRFSDTGRKLDTAHGDEYFYATLLMPDFNNHLDSNAAAIKIRGYWSFNLNQIDLEMGREFFVSKWLTLRPHAGVRTDWIHQNLKGSYYGIASHAFYPTQHDALAAYHDHWWGMGLAGGLDTQWGLGRGWSIFANATTAMLYGFHRIELENTALNFHGAEDALDYADLNQTFHTSHPILDLQLGLRWDHMCCSDRFHFGFDLGWEHHVFFSQNQFPLFTDDYASGAFVANQGNLSMQGWTFSARFDF